MATSAFLAFRDRVGRLAQPLDGALRPRESDHRRNRHRPDRRRDAGRQGDDYEYRD